MINTDDGGYKFESDEGIGGWVGKPDLFLSRVGAADVPVLLQGETGVGKEVLARRICACSPRAGKPFLKLNCAALPSELVESELFGYERGAFTGAFRTTPGKFEMADGGTILLDEIGDMDFKLQAKLLQVLQDGEFLRLGSKAITKVDVRVIAATHCNLEQAIDEGRFREDLYYRLNIIRIEVPPLRKRREDILPLARLFINKYSKPGETPVELNMNLSQALMTHAWPGNVRELQNAMRTLVALGDPDKVAEELRAAALRRQKVYFSRQLPLSDRYADDSEVAMQQGLLPRALPNGVATSVSGHAASARSSYTESSGLSLVPVADVGSQDAFHNVDRANRQAESEIIVEALNAALWNRKKAAKLLGIEYKGLLYKMKKLGIGRKVMVAGGLTA